MKKQIRGFLISFLISVPIFLLIGKYLSGPKENELQVKFEEERVLLFENKSSLNVARENDCNFISKYGSTFINWTGEIKYLDEDRIVIVSDVNGIEVQYKIYDWMFDNDGNDRNIKNEDIDIGDDVYFSFHPVQSESDEDECFDETSFTEAGALRAPEFIADIFQISKNTWEISPAAIQEFRDEHKEKINIKIRIKEEEERKRIAELERKLEKERIKKQQFEGSYYVGPSEDNCSFINFVFTSKGEYVVFTGNKQNNVKNCNAKGNYTYNQVDNSLNVSGFYNSNCYGTIEERNGIWKVKNNSIQAPNGVWFSKTSWSR